MMSKKETPVWKPVKLKPLLNKWCKKLKLLDWKIEVSYVKDSKMASPKTQGQIFVYPEWREATIEIVHYKYKLDVESHSIEYILVHELLHIPFDTLFKEKSRPDTIFMEQTINAITENLTCPDVRKCSI